LILLLLALLIGLVPAATLSTVSAQDNARYFPETGHFLKGFFRVFWESSGGLDVFGYPITEEYVSPQTGRTTQWFERARFEYVEINGQPYVELGLLGLEFTEGRVFPKVPPIENTADRRYIPETQHIVQYGFKTIWERYGEARIFGYPISEEIEEYFASEGTWRTVQYFERARFEYWPERPDGQRVLISNLGRSLVPPELTGPVPPEGGGGGGGGGTPTDPTWVPANTNAVVDPQIGPPGTTFRFAAYGFNGGERVGVWVDTPEGSRFDAGFQVRADDNGSIAHEGIGIITNEEFQDGVWAFVAQGTDSGAIAKGYFRISRGSTPAPAPAPGGTGVALPPPSFNDCKQDPNFANAPNFPIQIVTVDKNAEIVVLRNAGTEVVDLNGWRMCSVAGSQEHLGIGGSLAPGEQRGFPHTGGGDIWRNDQRDDAALYNAQGQVISYWTDPED
jgi:hypothetical protein